MNEYIERVIYSYVRKGIHIIKTIIKPKPPITLADCVSKVTISSGSDPKIVSRINRYLV